MICQNRVPAYFTDGTLLTPQRLPPKGGVMYTSRRGSRAAYTIFRKTVRNEEKKHFFINYLPNEAKTTKKFKR